MGSMIRFILITPLLGTVAAVGLIFAQAQPAFAWELEGQCVDADTVSVRTSVPGPYPNGFSAYAEDHVPGGGWEEVDGSEEFFEADSSVFEFTLDVTEARTGADQFVVILSSGEETDPFDVCPHPPSPRAPSTPVSTVTKVVHATKTPERSHKPRPTQTKVVESTKTPVPVVPVSTPTMVRKITTTVVVPSPPPGIKLPEAGSGAAVSSEDASLEIPKLILLLVMAVPTLVVVGTVLVGLVYLHVVHPPTR